MDKFYKRNIYEQLLDHCSKKQITVITGMRRTGKSTLLKKLLFDIKSSNQLYLDLQRIDNQELFSEKNFDNIILQLQQRGLDAEKKIYLAIDEIQLLPNIAGVIKYLYDQFDIKFIVTGSSSYYLKNLFNESLAGRKKIFELFPLDFGEFLTFKSVPFQRFNFGLIKFDSDEYNRLKFYYDEFVRFGGFPEVALNDDINTKKDLLLDILSSYINIDIKILADFRKFESLNKLIKLLAARVGSQVDYSKLANSIGVSRIVVKDYLSFLENTYLIKTVPVNTKNIDKEVIKSKKVYFCDNGLANILAELSSGAQFENAVFNQLRHFGSVGYYALRSGRKIDFVLNNEYGIEAKETPSQADFNALKSVSDKIKIRKAFLVGRYVNDKFAEYIWGGAIR